MRSRQLGLLFAVTLLPCVNARAADAPTFAKGPPSGPEHFPIAVWLQATPNAARYRDIGINTYVGLWRGPTEDQLNELDKAGIRLICSQNERSLAFKDRATIVGWMHGDEPDNAQSLGEGKGYGPPVAPRKIIEEYQAMRKADPDRPVILNLGQGVAWDGWRGRGVRTNHPEDYREYLKGCDIASFDIYPSSHKDKEIVGNLWYVPRGIDRLRQWSDPSKDIWCVIETTRISNVDRKPIPRHVRSEVWMALIHGAKGVMYFAHEFKPKFIEAGLLADREMASEVGALNRRIHELAPVLNSPDVKDGASVASSDQSVPIDLLVKRHAGATYVFAVAMRDGATNATFTLPGRTDDVRVEVLGEDRHIDARGGRWTDAFDDYQVHLYRITSP